MKSHKSETLEDVFVAILRHETKSEALLERLYRDCCLVRSPVSPHFCNCSLVLNLSAAALHQFAAKRIATAEVPKSFCWVAE